MTNAPQSAPDGVEYVDVDVEVGIIVQSLMFRHRHRQEDLGRILGVQKATVSRKLRGMVTFSVTELMKIARAYDVDPGDLLPRLDSNQQPCGYEQPQVSDADMARWGERMDAQVFVVADHLGVVAAWRDWLRSEQTGRPLLAPDESCDAWNEQHDCGLPEGHPGDHKCDGCGTVWNRSPVDDEDEWVRDEPRCRDLP